MFSVGDWVHVLNDLGNGSSTIAYSGVVEGVQSGGGDPGSYLIGCTDQVPRLHTDRGDMRQMTPVEIVKARLGVLDDVQREQSTDVEEDKCKTPR